VREAILTAALQMVGTTPFDSEQWCGKFCLLSLHKCNLAKDIDFTNKTGQLLCSKLERISAPQHADIVKLSFRDIVHYAIVITYSSDLNQRTSVLTVDGGTFDDLVKVQSHEVRANTEFYSVSSLFQKGA
jgi:hypothetical protein